MYTEENGNVINNTSINGNGRKVTMGCRWTLTNPQEDSALLRPHDHDTTSRTATTSALFTNPASCSSYANSNGRGWMSSVLYTPTLTFPNPIYITFTKREKTQ